MVISGFLSYTDDDNCEINNNNDKKITLSTKIVKTCEVQIY